MNNQDKQRLMIINWFKSRPRACEKVIVLEIQDQGSCISRKLNKKQEYTGLEHRQTLRACDFPCDLQIEIYNFKKLTNDM